MESLTWSQDFLLRRVQIVYGKDFSDKSEIFLGCTRVIESLIDNINKDQLSLTYIDIKKRSKLDDDRQVKIVIDRLIDPDIDVLKPIFIFFSLEDPDEFKEISEDEFMEMCIREEYVDIFSESSIGKNEFLLRLNTLFSVTNRFKAAVGTF